MSYVDPKVVLNFEKKITFQAKSIQIPNARSPVLLNFILWVVSMSLDLF